MKNKYKRFLWDRPTKFSHLSTTNKQWPRLNRIFVFVIFAFGMFSTNKLITHTPENP